MMQVYDRNLRKVAVLQNAYGVKETKKMNAIDTLSFSLPYNDPKNAFCAPFTYVRNGEGSLYRIAPCTLTKEDTGGMTYDCEHVIATLMDNVLYGHHVVGNLGVYTKDVIGYVLGKQLTRNWVLERCDFSRQFEYGWEQENLLGALFSIPKSFAEPYQWQYDTSGYPWKLSLTRLNLEAAPQLYIRARHNLLNISKMAEPREICTRLYPLGYGEGVNQLTIREVNGGVPYLQSPKAVTDRYGIIERVWVDRRYEDPASLKAAAQAMLNSLQEPHVEFKLGFAELKGSDFDRAAIGKIARVVDEDTGIDYTTYVTEITRNGEETASSAITVANAPQDIAATVADLADRQWIEMTYAQGATQIYGQSVQANATPQVGAVLNFYIPTEMRIVNAVKAKISLDAFRSYSRSTSGGGNATQTSSSGGGGTQTSSSGGGGTRTSSSGGGGTATSTNGGGTTRTTSSGGAINVTSGQNRSGTTSSGGINLNRTLSDTQYYTDLSPGRTSMADGHAHNVPKHSHIMALDTRHTHKLEHTHEVSTQAHTHQVTVPDHNHQVSVPSHAHSVSLSAHTHSVNIPQHTHSVSIPSHTHDIQQGIFTFGNATNASIWVGGMLKGYMGKEYEVDLTDWLLDSQGKIPRGAWLKVEVRPNDLAYVSIDLIVQGFVQSRGGTTA